MIFEKNKAKETAEFLLQIKAIKLSPKNPFTWASGWKSPIYCDNRVALSHVQVRTFIREILSKIIDQKYGKPDAIAGVATGAIAIGALVAQELGLPFIYVRPEPKKHGRQNQIEGQIEKHQSVVVVEDLISTGGSSLKAVEALRDQEIKVKGMVAIFTYGFKVAVENFAAANVELTTISDYDTLIEQAVAREYVPEEDQFTLQKWRLNPSEWEG
ncbi:orotate phosphoribosyltransferase [Aureibaculum conchae]|uniref:orotate phosphoribosyltransferase n=1 Tax=Aureibaculum sp. 2308TA14-22 TaxID=3108392 RepID=UPI0033971160